MAAVRVIAPGLIRRSSACAGLRACALVPSATATRAASTFAAGLDQTAEADRRAKAKMSADALAAAAVAKATLVAAKKKQAALAAKLMPLSVALQALKADSAEHPRKFVQTVEVAVGCTIDKGEILRGVVLLPKSSGKELRLWVFAKGKNAEDALAAGANRAGGDELVADILKGTLDFDRCFATPDMMPVVAKVARVLGPRGLMPTTKNGTVTENIAQSVQNAKFAKEFRSDKAGIVHGGIGKENFDNESLEANIRAFVQGIKNSRGPGKSNKFIEYGFISTSMGKGFKFDVKALL